MKHMLKTVLFIVEGSSDKSALERIFRKLYQENRNITFRFTSGDITSDETATISNIERKVKETIDAFLKDTKLIRSDLYQVIQIFDTDGAYIPDTAINSGSTKEFYYTPSSISCKTPCLVKERNKRKKELMDYLEGLKEIDHFPYEVYYMSSNLDHALYGKPNLEDALKQVYADSFYEQFKDHPEWFVPFLQIYVSNGVPTTLQDSWKYIKEDMHSLERHTNLHLYFRQHPIL